MVSPCGIQGLSASSQAAHTRVEDEPCRAMRRGSDLTARQKCSYASNEVQSCGGSPHSQRVVWRLNSQHSE